MGARERVSAGEISMGWLLETNLPHGGIGFCITPTEYDFNMDNLIVTEKTTRLSDFIFPESLVFCTVIDI